MAAHIRCLRATQGVYDIVYLTMEECVQGMIYDKYFANQGIRMICRGNFFERRPTSVVEFVGAHVDRADTLMRTRIAEALRRDHYTDVTLVKYADDMPIDISLDDPIITMTAYAHSDALKKYLAMR